MSAPLLLHPTSTAHLPRPYAPPPLYTRSTPLPAPRARRTPDRVTRPARRPRGGVMAAVAYEPPANTDFATYVRNGSLLEALGSPDLHDSLTPALLLRADPSELYTLLPLVLAGVQRVGETRGRRKEFSGLAKALRTRVSASRSVKLRLLMLARTPGFNEFWNIPVVHRASVYPAAKAALAAALQAEGDDAPGKVVEAANSSGVLLKVSSEQLPEVKAEEGGTVARTATLPRTPVDQSAAADQWEKGGCALYRFAATELFDPRTGVSMRPHKRMYRVHHKSFTAAEVVDALMERGNFMERARAVAVGRKLQDAGIIVKIGRPGAFEDGGKLYHSPVALHEGDGRHADITDENGKKMRCWEMAKESTGQEPYKRVELKIACDMVDLQSLDFWTGAVFLKDPTKGHVYGYRSITHPLACARISSAVTCGTGCELKADRLSMASSASSDAGSKVTAASKDEKHDSDSGGEGETASYTSRTASTGSLSTYLDPAYQARSGRADADVVNTVKVVKVFSSIARPMIIEVGKLRDDGGLAGNDDDVETVNPRLLVKEGDNLGQDLAVELLFRIFNTVWKKSDEFWKNPEDAPFAVEYEVFPTSAKQGFMEAVTGLTSLKEFDWDAWVKTRSSDPAAVHRMVASAAGSYMGAYLLGAADRHTENVQIQDNLTMLHIDFGYLLGLRPPIDGPQIAIYPQMEAAFRKVGAWDDFVKMCVDAFLAVRRVAPPVIRCAVVMFSKFGFSSQQVRDYMTSAISLNTHEPNELVAAAVVRNYIKNSSSDWKTKFKSYSHSNIDPLFYSALQKKFGPAVLAMKIVDGKNQAASKKLEAAASHKEAVPARLTSSIDDE